MEDLLKLGSRMINLPPSGLTGPLYPWIFWVLWTSRNQLMFEDKSFSETEMVLKAIKAAKEWQESLPQRKKRSASSKDCHTSNSLSQVPTNAHIVFSDAAWNSSTGAGGLSWICTDAEGAHRFQGTDTRRYIASALVAEALALKAGLSQAISSGIKDVICVSDSKCLIDLITGNKTVVALRGMLHDISVLSQSFSSISFRFIPRTCNEPADRLAKNSLFQFSKHFSEMTNSVIA
ncbi:hypothetical protein IGI04_025819 [Brassica rapa subsp. trilocularis]|uniref:RNase H type-1 domain-containing protein n=1 Tax=Brassica rapa subsp. trilocularis TaxID=1813537 RepID=A0ABQ7KU63_BRACM|nr:hypothetical protein IGI04_025819 [Brassica rapa subsp. trilocularis]